MAQIPLGNFGRAVPVAEQGRVVTIAPSNAGAQAADEVKRVALGALDQIGKENQALARVKASNALIDRESQLKTIGTDIGEKMRLGEVSHDKAEETYAAAVSQLKPLETPGLDEVTMGEVGNSLKRLQNSGLDVVRHAAAGARIESAKADLTSRMDMLGKDSALPGADIEAINRRMDADDIDLAGRMAYGEGWADRKQDFKDSNWTTHATQRVIGARDGLGTLRQIENDLTAADGFYAKKLDPEKRNQLLNTVTGRIFQVQEQHQRKAEMRELAGMRTLDQMDKQAASGLPPTPADQQRWAASLSGTSMAPEYKTRIGQMNEVQSLLRQPIGEQMAYLEQKRQSMAANGASVTDQANVNRLQSAVDQNVKLLRDEPLAFNALRTGEDAPPLDVTAMATPEGQQQVADQLAQRFDTLGAMRKQYGPDVARNPWKPEEAAMLKAFIGQVDDGSKLKFLATLAAASPSGTDYAAALKPLAADDPATMLAGMAQFRGLKSADGADVAKFVLSGSKVLKDKSTPMPSENELRTAFDDQVGTSISSGTPQRDQAYLAFKSLYAGLAGPSGVTHDGPNPMINGDLADKAIQMATGGIGERAGAKVVKPYNMDDDAFDTAVDTQLEALTQSSGFLFRELEDMPLSPVPGREGAYYLLNAGRIQLDPKTGEPMMVNIK